MRPAASTVFRALCAALLALLVTGAHAQAGWPSKPIKVLVGVPPGGSTDALTRMVAEWLQESLGQPAVVENRPGANTAVAADAVARSAPDGHTLLVTTEAFLTMPLLTRTSFDPFKDFAPVGTVAANRFVFLVHPSVPANNLQEFIAYARARPGRVNYGSSGSAGASHLGIEKFKMLTGTHIVHIPYRGAGPALTDGIGGQYELSMWTPLAVAGHVKAGKLRPLAVTGPRRMAALPDVPTFAEAGLPRYDHSSWLSVYAPAGTPRAIVDRLNAELARMVASPKVAKRFEDSGVEAFLSSPEQLTALMRRESAEMARLIKDANIHMD